MIKLNAVVKVVPNEEAKIKAEEDLEIKQPTKEEAQKIIAKYCEEEKEINEED